MAPPPVAVDQTVAVPPVADGNPYSTPAWGTQLKRVASKARRLDGHVEGASFFPCFSEDLRLKSIIWYAQNNGFIVC